MIKLCQAVAFATLMLFAHIAFAEPPQCSAVVTGIVAKHLKLSATFSVQETDEKTQKQTGIIVAEACKVSQQADNNDGNIVIVAFAYDLYHQQHPEKMNDEDEGTKDLIVALVDVSKKRVISSYQTQIVEDALTHIADYSFAIDTARYQLAPNVRAFGLRFNSDARGPSCADGRWGDELTLFVQNGEKLQPVLGVPMTSAQAIKGCMGSGVVSGSVSDDADLTLGVQKTRHNGYADLLLTAKITRFDSSKPYVDKEKMRFKTAQYLLLYDGKKYAANKKDTPWWLLNGVVTVN